jgi:hypothetical protein
MRRFLLVAAEAATLAVAISLLVVGISAWSSAAGEASKTRAALRAAEGWNDRAHRRFVNQRTAAATLTRQLRTKRATIRALSKQAATGFSDARTAGWRAGERAGRAAGTSEGGREAVRRALLRGSDSGWYIVKIGWSYGLPVIDDYWTLDPGETFAYYVDDGEAFHRETIG